MAIAQKIKQIRAERPGGNGAGTALAPPPIVVQKIIGHPELEGRTHLYRSAGLAEYMAGYADYAQVYEVYSWVHRAIQVIAWAISPLPVMVANPDGELVPEHPLSSLLAYTNPTMGPSDLWDRWLVDMMLCGESFIEVVDSRRGEPIELWPRRPDLVKVVPDRSEAAFEHYPRVAGYLFTDDELPIPAEGMHHDKFVHPRNPWRGLAPIAALRQSITIDLFSQSYSKELLKRGARPDYAVIAPEGVTRGEREDMIARLMTEHSGPGNVHRPIVLEEGITDIKPLSFPPKDIEWLQQREFARDEVAAIFGVPDEIMGFGRNTYENFETAFRVLWLLTLQKLTERRDRGLTHHFTKTRALLPEGWAIQTDLSRVGEVQEDLAPKLDMATVAWGMGVPFNVVDERLNLGLGPIPGGDVGYIQSTLVPIGLPEPEPPPMPPPALPEPEPGEGPEGDSGEGPSAEPGEEGEEAEDESGPPPRATGPPVVKARDMSYGGPNHAAVWKAFERRLRQHELRMKMELKRQFQKQQDRVLGKLKQRLGKEWATAIHAVITAPGVKQEGEALGALIADLLLASDEAFDFPYEKQVFVKEFGPYFGAAIEEFGQAQLTELVAGISFDEHNPLVVDAARTMAIKFADDITQTTQAQMAERVRILVGRAEEEGHGIPELQADIYRYISEVFNVRKKDYETERIARTEMTKAANLGKMEGMRQSGVVERKCWLAALDHRTRTTHVQAHLDYSEEGIPLDEMFVVGIDEMLQPGGGSVLAEIINCRCTIVPRILEPFPGPEGAPEAPAPPAPEEPKPEEPAEVTAAPAFPERVEDVEYVRGLGGSTGADLVRDPASGDLYVRKRGASPEHIREEFWADNCYRALGSNVPEARLYETASGPVKLARYIPDTESLAEVMASGDKRRISKIKGRLQKDFVSDALMGNWDVLGLNMDNILIDAEDTVWRIDNGGSFRFRAMGQKKDAGAYDKWVTELWTMRDPARGNAFEMYGDRDWYFYAGRCRTLTQAKYRRGLEDALSDPMVPESLRSTVMDRLETLKDVGLIGKTFQYDGGGWASGYVDNFTKASVGIRKAGVVDSFPKELRQRRGSRRYVVVDENGREWDNLRGHGSAIAKLDEYMQENGGDMGVISYWASSQGANSWKNAPVGLKYWLVEKQGGDPDDFFWGKGKTAAQAREQLQKARARVGPEKWDASYTSFHAFNYELMRNVSFPRNNQRRHYVELMRTESYGVMQRNGFRNVGEVRDNMKRGAAESSSIFVSVRVSGDQLTLQRVPHHRIFGTYFPERDPGTHQYMFYGDGENEFIFMPSTDLDVYWWGQDNGGQSHSTVWSRWK